MNFRLRQSRHRIRLFSRRVLFPYKGWVFWSLVSLVLAGAMVALYADAKTGVTYCESPNPRASAYLVLAEIDSSGKTIKTALLVPTFDRNKHELMVGTFAESAGPTRFSWDPRIAPRPQGQTGEATRSLEGSLPYKSSSFWYPFDHSQLDLLIDLQKSEIQTPIRVQVENKINGLVLQPCDSHYSRDDASAGITTNRFSIVLRRHRFVQVIAVTFLVIAVTFLFYIAKREDKTKVLSSSLGYIAALWGIRQILMGSEKLFPTIVDFLTLGLYITVAIIVFHKLLFGKDAVSTRRQP